MLYDVIIVRSFKLVNSLDTLAVFYHLNDDDCYHLNDDHSFTLSSRRLRLYALRESAIHNYECKDYFDNLYFGEYNGKILYF